MSSPALVLNGNQFQGLSAAQLQQLNAIASMAKGSRFFEGSNGGNGFMGSFVDNTTGQTHYIKMLTQSDERGKAFDDKTEITGQNEDAFLKTESGKRLETMSIGLKSDLLALAEQVGVKKDLENLFASSKNEFKTLMTRKIVAQAVSRIKDAHNQAVGADSKRSFSWKTVAHAGTEKNTTLGAVFRDIDAMLNASKSGSQNKVNRATTVAGENHQQSMGAILQKPSPSPDDIKTFIDNFKSNYCPRNWAKDLNEASNTLQKKLPNGVNVREFIAGLLEDAIENPNVSKSIGTNILSAAWNSVKSAVRLLGKSPSNVPEQHLKDHFKVLLGVSALSLFKDNKVELERNLLSFAGKCAQEGLADVVSEDIAKGANSIMRSFVFDMGLNNNVNGYKDGFNAILGKFEKLQQLNARGWGNLVKDAKVSNYTEFTDQVLRFADKCDQRNLADIVSKDLERENSILKNFILKDATKLNEESQYEKGFDAILDKFEKLQQLNARGWGNLVKDAKVSNYTEFTDQVLRFADKCDQSGLADIVSKDLKSNDSLLKDFILNDAPNLKGESQYEQGFAAILDKCKLKALGLANLVNEVKLSGNTEFIKQVFSFADKCDQSGLADIVSKDLKSKDSLLKDFILNDAPNLKVESQYEQGFAAILDKFKLKALGLDNLVEEAKLSGNQKFMENVLDFADKCLKRGLANIAADDIAKGKSSLLVNFILNDAPRIKDVNEIKSASQQYEDGFVNLLNHFKLTALGLDDLVKNVKLNDEQKTEFMKRALFFADQCDQRGLADVVSKDLKSENSILKDFILNKVPEIKVESQHDTAPYLVEFYGVLVELEDLQNTKEEKFEQSQQKVEPNVEPKVEAKVEQKVEQSQQKVEPNVEPKVKNEEIQKTDSKTTNSERDPKKEMLSKTEEILTLLNYLANELVANEGDRARYRNEAGELKQQIDNINKEIEKCDDGIKTANNETKRLSSEIESCETEILKLYVAKKDLPGDNADTKKALYMINTDIKDLEKTKGKLENALSKENVNFAALTDRKEYLSKTLSILAPHLKDVEDNLSKFKELDSDPKLVNNLKDELSSFRDALKKMETEWADVSQSPLIAKIDVLAGCNGTTEVLKCLHENPGMFRPPISSTIG